MQRQVHGTTRRVLDFLIEYHAAHGYAPSQREICAALYFTQSTAIYHLEKLDAAGAIRLGEHGQSRAIDLRPSIAPALAQSAR